MNVRSYRKVTMLIKLYVRILSEPGYICEAAFDGGVIDRVKYTSRTRQRMTTQLMEFLKQASKKRFAWILLALSALLLELVALYFQYGKMELQPCVLCIYERTAVMGIFLAGLLGAIAPQLLLFRWAGFLLWGSSAVWGLMLALEHSGIQQNSMTASCDFIAKFPAWAKLDEWFPLLFNPTGFCDEIQWRFLGYTMPQTMIGINLLYLLALLVIVAAQLERGLRTED